MARARGLGQEHILDGFALEVAMTPTSHHVSHVPISRECSGAGLSPMLLCAETHPARLLLEIQCFSSMGEKKKKKFLFAPDREEKSKFCIFLHMKIPLSANAAEPSEVATYLTIACP